MWGQSYKISSPGHLTPRAQGLTSPTVPGDLMLLRVCRPRWCLILEHCSNRSLQDASRLQTRRPRDSCAHASLIVWTLQVLRPLPEHRATIPRRWELCRFSASMCPTLGGMFGCQIWQLWLQITGVSMKRMSQRLEATAFTAEWSHRTAKDAYCNRSGNGTQGP
jgi:hypothetical protein